MPDRQTKDSVDLAAGLTFDAIPDSAIQIAKRCLVDGIGVAITCIKTDVDGLLITHVTRQGGDLDTVGNLRLFGNPGSTFSS
ncbi:MAG: hypothetical protein P8L79_08895 [Rhodospirillaceae bacterium]|jgi:hypothetical protein|nr:hypothetical protein [Rhodospirillaceae bacterium]